MNKVMVITALAASLLVSTAAIAAPANLADALQPTTGLVLVKGGGFVGGGGGHIGGGAGFSGGGRIGGGGDGLGGGAHIAGGDRIGGGAGPHFSGGDHIGGGGPRGGSLRRQ